MSIDPHIIRSERHSTIGSIIQRDASLLLERWRQRAIQEQPNAQRVHQEVLLDQLSSLLAGMGRSLSSSDAIHTYAHRAPALEHGEQRWESGWSLPEVVRDYQILRLVIIDYLEETLERPMRGREVMAIGLVLDEAIAASVGMYVGNREEHLRDVERQRTEQEKRAEESLTHALQEADRRKNEFVAMLSHELRNSLGPILNSIEVVRLAGNVPAPMEEARGLIERQAKQMVRLVDDLLDVSRVSRGEVELRKESLDLASVVEHAIETSRPLLESSKHELCVDLPAEPLRIEGDRARLVQVIVNLLNNAAKYTDPGGRIWLSAERRDHEAMIRVRDTGVGIPPEMLARVFDLFTQVDRSSERSRGGLGIGLALVHQLVRMHGGTVTAMSDGPGQGSEFIVRLPAQSTGPVAPEPTNPTATPIAPRHILLIEDNPDGRDTLATLLTLHGHRVETAEDGVRGIELAIAARPQVALVDLGLPRLDGYQVAQKLRAALGQEVCLVALTGFGQAEDRQRTMAAGFDAHLVKPVDADELLRLLASLPLRPC